MVGDPELKAMNAIARAYDSLSDDDMSQAMIDRVLAWAKAKYHASPCRDEEPE